MSHKPLVAVTLSVIALGVAGCDPKLFAQFTGGNKLTGTQSPGESSGATASVGVPTASPTTFGKQNVQLMLVRDPYYTYFSVYTTPHFDFATGTDSVADDYGQVEFGSRSGMTNPDDNGNFIFGRQYSSKQVVLGFIDKGAVALDSITEVPEFGWSAAPVGNRNKVKVTPGNCYLIRAQYPATNSTFYGKVWVKDWSGDKVLFDYVWQTATGSRSL